MSIKEAEGKIAALEAELHTLAPMDPHAEELRTTIATLREEAMRNMDAWDTVSYTHLTLPTKRIV